MVDPNFGLKTWILPGLFWGVCMYVPYHAYDRWWRVIYMETVVWTSYLVNRWPGDAILSF